MLPIPSAQEILAEALKIYSAGFLPIPLHLYEHVHPSVSWSKWRDNRPTRQQIVKEFAIPRGLAVLAGQGGFEALDFDCHETEGNEFQEWCSLVPKELLRKLVIYLTPRKGFRACWRTADPFKEKKLVLAWRHEKEASIELLSGWPCVVPGGHPSSHHTGKPFRYVRGHVAEVLEINSDERSVLLEMACKLSKWTCPPKAKKERCEFSPDEDIAPDWHPWDDFNQQVSWADILEPHNWTETGNFWRRPGTTKGHSATTKQINGRDIFYCFSSSTDFQQKGYEKWAVWAVLNHGGDYKAAVEQLTLLGYGRVNRINEEFDNYFKVG